MVVGSNPTRPVDLHVRLTQFHRVFVFKSDPAPNGKSLVLSVYGQIFHGVIFSATTGLNLDANQHKARLRHKM